MRSIPENRDARCWGGGHLRLVLGFRITIPLAHVRKRTHNRLTMQPTKRIGSTGTPWTGDVNSDGQLKNNGTNNDREWAGAVKTIEHVQKER
jgi:hypothetical protein